MTSLNEEMADVQTEIDRVRDRIRTDVPTLFKFDVTVSQIEYNATNNSVTLTVEPSSNARTQISDEFGGVRVKMEDQLTFEFQFSSQE
ncbi:hypothetical protein C482_19836 [Natrialba chahannaoensis JCM 10990]|uniref:Uncharacterized protein n=1 Tax=Natrialba chahannaoensis JCM 10990 TaxID=1227492 RepID=M0A3A9_9EURY|nr:hypothetical protein [Natrialba chahannaoensis]ELY93255.1 hypothetical protein C482_19836 [Natrialba chahannaoensis JCM 10990]